MADIGSSDVVDSREFEVSFHGYDYVVNVSVPGDFLDIQVEQERSNDRWRGRFTAQYIEVRAALCFCMAQVDVGQWVHAGELGVGTCLVLAEAYMRESAQPERSPSVLESCNVRMLQTVHHPYSSNSGHDARHYTLVLTVLHTLLTPHTRTCSYRTSLTRRGTSKVGDCPSIHARRSSCCLLLQCGMRTAIADGWSNTRNQSSEPVLFRSPSSFG